MSAFISASFWASLSYYYFMTGVAFDDIVDEGVAAADACFYIYAYSSALYLASIASCSLLILSSFS